MKPDYRTSLIACRLALVLAPVVSCRQIVDFAEAPPPSDDAGAGTLFDPKPLFQSSPECLRCKEEYCQPETAACDADEFCSSFRDQVKALRQPLQTAISLLQELSDAQWNFDHGGANVSQALNVLGGCANDHCTSACDFGRDFSCVGKFDWPATFPKRTEIRLGVSDGIIASPRFDALRVSACARQSVCQSPMGEATTQGGGFATLAVDSALAPPGVGAMPFFDGFLQVDAAADFLPAQLDTSTPFFDLDYYGIYMTSAKLVHDTSENKGFHYDENQGLLEVWPWDCNYVKIAKGVTVEVWNSTEAGFRPCGADCAFAYPDDGGQADVTLEDFSSRGYGPAIANVAAGDVMVVMRDTKTRLPLSVLRPVTIRAGFVHTIHMRPASAEQLARLPKDAE